MADNWLTRFAHRVDRWLGGYKDPPAIQKVEEKPLGRFEFERADAAPGAWIHDSAECSFCTKVAARDRNIAPVTEPKVKPKPKAKHKKPVVKKGKK